MKPVKNVFPAFDSSEKGYSVNRSESTLMLVRWKQDEDKTIVVSVSLNRFDFVPKTHRSSGHVELGNSKKNRNIKAHLSGQE